jgi:dihydroxyacetone kinase
MPSQVLLTEVIMTSQPHIQQAMSRCLLNDPTAIVAESMRGLLATRPDLVRLVDPARDRTLIVAQRRSAREHPSHVAVISGGGAGHEPLHGGLVGRGLLTAAVSGDVFASPTAAAVLCAIRGTCGPVAGDDGAKSGCLLVVKNYTGDRLAFGLAAETARCEGFAVETVIVADDVAVDGGAREAQDVSTDV